MLLCKRVLGLLGCLHTSLLVSSRVVLQPRTVVKSCTPPAALVGLWLTKQPLLTTATALAACSPLTVSDYINRTYGL
eukprot:6269293-Amphidinium_carterae.3